jgi:hypothetical protein
MRESASRVSEPRLDMSPESGKRDRAALEDLLMKRWGVTVRHAALRLSPKLHDL